MYVKLRTARPHFVRTHPYLENEIYSPSQHEHAADEQRQRPRGSYLHSWSLMGCCGRGRRRATRLRDIRLCGKHDCGIVLPSGSDKVAGDLEAETLSCRLPPPLRMKLMATSSPAVAKTDESGATQQVVMLTARWFGQQPRSWARAHSSMAGKTTKRGRALTHLYTPWPVSRRGTRFFSLCDLFPPLPRI